MCFYEQLRRDCGHEEWGKLRLPCEKKNRENEETCSLKLAHFTRYVDTPCKLCGEIKEKEGAINHTEDFVGREAITKAQAEAAESLIRQVYETTCRLSVDHDDYTWDATGFTDASPMSTSQGIGEGWVGPSGKQGDAEPRAPEAAFTSPAGVRNLPLLDPKSFTFPTPASLRAQYAVDGGAGSFGIDKYLEEPVVISQKFGSPQGKPEGALVAPSQTGDRDMALEGARHAWPKQYRSKPTPWMLPKSIESRITMWDAGANPPEFNMRAEGYEPFLDFVRLPL